MKFDVLQSSLGTLHNVPTAHEHNTNHIVDLFRNFGRSLHLAYSLFNWDEVNGMVISYCVQWSSNSKRIY